ncbi:SDR family oxidoreductase [Azohydromonas caseinilytica]|uniref:SDR family oxidoreductase n=1 Tax=Azohydromonas caseinilytica TaxID=2728836 RepID=A0A848FHM5_9BURK|nr:SDR family oxidoreductase [Azohydromonas caseinilytica]NML18646.1 SDR family oxidoreductase [Azohydromonas caseinilytica]
MSRLALITGASSGIGQALAAHALQAGWRVVLVARRTELLQAWAQAQPAAERVAIYGADVRDPQAMAAMGRACIAAHGVPDVVIANAGISVGMDSAELEDLQVLKETLEINVLGMAATFHPFLAAMRERRAGTLVGIGSVAAIRGLPGHGAYCASKAAVLSYCESLRGECRPYGVRVLTLSPGYVDTPLTRGNPYPMPFLMSPEAFARSAWRAIDAGVSYRVIPWPMAVVAKLLRILPNALFDRVFAGRPRKPRRGG